MRRADFRRAQFHGPAWFDRTEFCVGTFGEAQFHDSVEFDGARFGKAWFALADFQGFARFDEAQFHELAMFSDVRFHGFTTFIEAQFDAKPSLYDSWARLDFDSDSKSVWPSGWVVDDIELMDEHGGRWGMLVPDDTFDGIPDGGTEG